MILLLACQDPLPKDSEDPQVLPIGEAGVGDMVFTDATDAWGLGGVNASQMQAVDLDGDGFADLVLADNAGIDAPGDAERFHWIWMNREQDGRRVFEDATEESGFFQRRSGDGFRPSIDHVFADMDGDGDLDGFAGVFNDPHTAPDTHYTDFSDVLLNDGTGHFELAPLSPDLQVDFPMSGATLADVDGDGVVDLYISLWYQNEDIYRDGSWLNWIFGANDVLLRGEGDGTFTDISDAAGIEMADGTSASAQAKVLDGTHARPGMGATACDLTGDGAPELLEMAYGRQWNLLWRNEGAGTFEEIGRESGYAGDDDIDYTDDWYYMCWCWSNGTCDAPEDPEFPYTERQCGQVAAYWSEGWSDEPANLNGNTFSTACADIDNDGHLDLWTGEIFHEWAGGSSDASGLLLNDGTAHFERPDLEEMGLWRTGVEDPSTTAWDFGDQKSAVGDFDLDGRKDLMLPSGAYYGNFLYIWRQYAPLEFSEVQTDLGIDVPAAHGTAIADFDRDGDLDFLTSSLTQTVEGSAIGHRLYLWENGIEGQHWLRVKVGGSQPVGTRVAVTAGGVTQVLVVDGGHGQHGMQDETALTFGFGPVDVIDAVEVTWRDGTVEHLDATVDTELLINPG